jgi:ubiquinone/menaquinone biosynthesis C-methylase UbiE
MADTAASADDIIRVLRSSAEAYREASRKEGSVWGRMFSDPAFLAIRDDDQAAAAELGLNRDTVGLLVMLQRAGLKPRSGLSLGCGSGRGERALLERRICERFVGVDVAPQAIEEARQLAEKDGLPIRYVCQDINAIALGDERFDLVVCQTILHHVLELEHVLDEIERVLSPEGVFYVHDYIGETQFQFSDERLEWINAVLAALPEPLRTSRVGNKVLKQVGRPVPGKLVSPFEAIRSGEISALLKQRFDIVECHEHTTIMDRVVPMGTRRGYLADANTHALFDLLKLLDKALLQGGVLPPVEGRYLLRRKQR